MPVTSRIGGFSVVPYPVIVQPVMLSMQGGNPMENSALGQNVRINNSSAMFVGQVPVHRMPSSSAMVDLNYNQQFSSEPSPLSLRLSLSSGQDQSSSTRESAFQVISTSRMEIAS